ncbi:AraC family transcriptional regulator [Mucilaginibacter sp. BT774]|uniref:AraC family transcriptional regulator n=1 Tax=Mucilaginibacter sp. BT774 TaxID=3062276 RepID=UPI002676CDD3|nr:AraC family transcriptional regulator [Mucilaginibacter sp. BT774]MDO3625324.1 AraC family transcriptional regulator [Mucilaginibacter sp. BT774]
MKVLQFTIPVVHDKSVITEQVELPYHYPYLHRHKEVQVTWIQRGEGTLIAGNNMHAYSSGEIYFLGGSLPHLFKSNPEYFKPGNGKMIKAMTLFFNPAGLLSPLFELPEMKSLKLFLQQHQQGFKVPDNHFQQVSQAMIEVKNAAGSNKLVQFFGLLESMMEIDTKLEPLSSYGDLPAITENEGIRIGNIYNYIMKNYMEAITLEDIAQAACMTPESFCRYFKKHTGHTFISFLNEIRINEACKKLTAHRFESISTVAYKCGFKSITNFNRVFKCVIGTSPREYLDNYLNSVNSASKIAS